MENKVEVELANAKIYDFKTNDGSVIQGLKIYYFDNEIKEGSITGDIQSSFFNSEKISNYKEVFDRLKEHYLDKKRSGLIPTIILYFTVKSINSKPVITKIDLA